jgi:hypothetical protein
MGGGSWVAFVDRVQGPGAIKRISGTGMASYCIQTGFAQYDGRRRRAAGRTRA